MKIYTKVVMDIETGNIIHEESYDYDGKLTLCDVGGSGSEQEVTIRYAPYIEENHEAFLDAVAAFRASTTGDSPFSDYTDIVLDAAFFGTGYTIASFPSLYDMYGKFMAGLDVDDLYSDAFTDIIQTSEVNDSVSAEAAMLRDHINTTTLPEFEPGMRDINSVMSSSFIVGKANIWDGYDKSVAKYSADLKYHLIPVVTQHWQTHLEWNRNVILAYGEIMKLYFSAKMEVDNFNYSMSAKDKLWPFTVLDFERAALGALQGATSSKSSSGGGIMDMISTAISIAGIAAAFA